MFCREEAARFGSLRLPEGVRLVFIGQGDGHYTRAFRQDHLSAVAAEVLMDFDGSSYRALEWTRQPWRLFHPGLLGNAWKAMRQGHRQGALQGDPFQNGGVVLIDASGEIVFVHRQAYPGDRMGPREEASFQKHLGSLGS